MNSTLMMERVVEVLPRFRARVAGDFWLLTILVGARTPVLESHI